MEPKSSLWCQGPKWGPHKGNADWAQTAAWEALEVKLYNNLGAPGAG